MAGPFHHGAADRSLTGWPGEPYSAACYADERAAQASIATWRRAGWEVVAAHHRPDLGDRPWLLWLRPVHPDGVR